MIAAPLASSAALFAEAFHALTDSAMLWPALVFAWRSYREKEADPGRHDRLADYMAAVMILSGILAIGFAGHQLVFDRDLHAGIGFGPALFGLGANAVQLALLLWCRRCRFHRLALRHLGADTFSSVFVTLELGLHLNEHTGFPVDAVGGALIGVWLIWQGLEGGHSR
jgi:Co/Zn/Cd efflux system component